jgi:hypothetical protein
MRRSCSRRRRTAGLCPADLPLTYYGELFEKAEQAVAYFWAEDPDELVALVGQAVRLAPLHEFAQLVSPYLYEDP